MRIPRRTATVSQVDSHTAKPDTFADSQQCSSSSGSMLFMAIPVFGYGFFILQYNLFPNYKEDISEHRRQPRQLQE